MEQQQGELAEVVQLDVHGIEPIRPEDRPKGLPWYEEGRSWLSTAVCFLAFFMGYKFGRK